MNHPESSCANQDVEIFRTLLGINARGTSKENDSDPKVKSNKTQSFDNRRSGKLCSCIYLNDGLYNRICERGSIVWWEFHLCKILIDLGLMAQIAFAATLTALGASRASHTAVTVFGAINVAIAALLALLKGQGQPMRLRKELFGLRKIRHYIEDRERMFFEGRYIKVEAEKCKCGCEKSKCDYGQVNGEDKTGKCLCEKDKCPCEEGHCPCKKGQCKCEKCKEKCKCKCEEIDLEVKTIMKMYEELMETIEKNEPDYYAGYDGSTVSKHQ